jgi:cbb3-type cytochrome oxidase subunit 1
METIDKSETINKQSSEDLAPAPGFLQVIWQAIRGTHISYDYTEGDLGHAIMLLAVPMVLEMLMESVFAVVDVFFVARLGPEAVAAVAITESLMTLIYTLAIGLGIGAMALVLSAQGLQQGFMLMTGAEFVDTVVSMRPYWWIRTLTGISMDVGMSLLVINLMRTSAVSRRLP